MDDIFNYDPELVADRYGSATSIRVTLAAGQARKTFTMQLTANIKGLEVMLAALCEFYEDLPRDEEEVKTLTLVNPDGSLREFKDTQGEEDIWLANFALSYEIFDCFQIDPRMFPAQESMEEASKEPPPPFQPKQSKFH